MWISYEEALDSEMERRGFSVVSVDDPAWPKGYALSWFRNKTARCNPEVLEQAGFRPEQAAEILMRQYYGF